MSNTPTMGPNTAAGQPDSASRAIVLKEVGAKWDKLSEQNLSALKNKDDLIAVVVEKYGLEKGQAQRDVDALLKGRTI